MKKLLIFLFIIIPGILIITYPFYSNFFLAIQVDGEIATYQSEAEDEQVNAAAMLEAAEHYNQKLKETGSVILGVLNNTEETDEPGKKERDEEYWNALDLNGSGMLGIIRIPAINVRLPIYHGTADDTLEKGVGHMEGTSFPIGGMGTHSVLTGHTGLSNAKLFTDLIQLEEEDVFIIEVLGNKYAYRVCDIFVVNPTDVSKLAADPNHDYVTLVTCTPYGINTERLLVRGERTEYHEEDEVVTQDLSDIMESKWQKEYLKSILIGAGVFLLIVLIGKRPGKGRNKKNKKEITYS
ncbi:MAG: class C sortase [Eubacteriales bacterium]|nr:class C sortase [Eubacteriales bacterium]